MPGVPTPNGLRCIPGGTPNFAKILYHLRGQPASRTHVLKVKTENGTMNFKKSAESYVDIKRNFLSPRIIKEYSETASRMPEWFCELRKC